MKKVFFQLGALMIFTLSLFMFCIMSGIYIFVKFLLVLIVNVEYGALIGMVMGIVPIYIFFPPIIYLLHNRVIMEDEKIIVTGNRTAKKEHAFQYPDEIRYDEIKDISIICANANSQKKRIKNAGYSSLRPYFFFEVTLKNEETKWIYIECFSRSQRKKMLNIINEKTGLNFTYRGLERKDYSIYRRKKKSNK